VIIVAVVLWMLQIFGIVGPPVPRLR
jgi:nitrate reductase NapE component